MTDLKSVAADCELCTELADPAPIDMAYLYRDDTWVVRAPQPSPLPGWIQVATTRHAKDLSDLNATEAQSLGAMLVDVQRAVLQATGALRMYTVSLCEGKNHFHATLVPRFADMPNGAIGYSAFQIARQVRNGDLQPANGVEADRVLTETKELLARRC